jgi:Domain of unknown function (DUF397)
MSGWRESSWSVGNGACVEAASGGSTVLVRDTAARGGTVLRFSAGAWTAFLAGITRSEP